MTESTSKDLIIREIIRPFFTEFPKIPASQTLVSHLTLLIGKSPSTLKLISHPNDLPIQFFCIIFTLLGQEFNLSNPSNKF